MIEKIIMLTFQSFENAKKVTCGGLFMIHGLLATVEGRFAPYTRDIVHRFLLHAAKIKDASDE